MDALLATHDHLDADTCDLKQEGVALMVGCNGRPCRSQPAGSGSAAASRTRAGT
jgi:hypothetical protein